MNMSPSVQCTTLAGTYSCQGGAFVITFRSVMVPLYVIDVNDEQLEQK